MKILEGPEAVNIEGGEQTSSNPEKLEFSKPSALSFSLELKSPVDLCDQTTSAVSAQHLIFEVGFSMYVVMVCVETQDCTTAPPFVIFFDRFLYFLSIMTPFVVQLLQ